MYTIYSLTQLSVEQLLLRYFTAKYFGSFLWSIFRLSLSKYISYSLQCFVDYEISCYILKGTV